MIFKVAVLQKRSLDRQPDQNTKTVLSAMEEAARLGADLLLLPECFLTGYELPFTNDEALADSDPHLTILCQAAAAMKIGLVATAITKGTHRPQNAAFLIDKSSAILMKYAKVHTCDFADERCLESGDGFQVCDFHGVKLGIMICYDREYPESARILMLKGAELILVPNDCGAMAPRVQALSTRAYENTVGIVMANPNGENAGCSCAFSPICWDQDGICIDNTLLLADDQTEGLFCAEFDLDALRHYRETEMMGNTFRKVHAYQALLSEEITEPLLREGQR